MWLLWILPLAAPSLRPAAGEVVNSLQSCSQFFLDGAPPNLQLNNTAVICQKYKRNYYFVTMYNRHHRIPVFSAYILHTKITGERNDSWKIEPQLAVPGSSQTEMVLEKDSHISHTVLANSQAVIGDYKNKDNYDKGHLAPVCHQSDDDSVAATFTLTNAVPMHSNLNRGQWKTVYEEGIKTRINSCITTYAIVGAVPGNTLLKNRVNIPSYIWAAVCCEFRNRTKTSWAFIAENKDKSTVSITTLMNLENVLKGLYNINAINLFYRSCN